MLQALSPKLAPHLKSADRKGRVGSIPAPGNVRRTKSGTAGCSDSMTAVTHSLSRATTHHTRSEERNCIPVSLALPILIAAGLVFFASFLLHMLLPFHRADYRPLPAEDVSMDTLRNIAIPPGDYMVPCAGTPEAMKNPAFRGKVCAGSGSHDDGNEPGELSMGGSLRSGRTRSGTSASGRPRSLHG
jgi:hypothetical protein